MANEEEKKPQKKPSTGFNILSGDSTDGHGGYGVGTINLDNVSPVIIDPTTDEIYVDVGALHARSALEKRKKLVKTREEVPDGHTAWIVWVTLQRSEDGPFYFGIGACEFYLNAEAKRAWKSMPEHVNNMDKSMKGRVIIDHMDAKSKKMLRDYLIEFDKDVYERSSEEVKMGLQD
ncbi:MAG: YwhD family protein [Anaerobacillus sp.]